MNVVFMSPHFPPQYHLFCRALKNRGVNVLGIADTPWDGLPEAVRASLCDFIHVADMGNHDAMIRALGLFTHRHGKIDRLDSLNEHWLDTEARLREEFNVPGQRPSDTSRNRSKSAMRAVFQSAGIPCTKGIKFKSAAEAKAFAAEQGFPCVLKPDKGVGASRTFRVNNEKELDAALDEGLFDYVIEAFTAGTLGSFDGLTDREGKIVFETSHVYSAGIMDIVNERLPMYYYSRRDIPARLAEYGRKSVAAFGIRERFFHVEFFELADGGYCALEVNVRPPGGFTTDLMNFAIDGDIYDLWARVLTEGAVPDFRYERKFHTMHVSRRNGDSYRLSHEQAIERLGGLLVQYREMPPAFAGAMGDHMYAIRGESLEPIIEAARGIQEMA